MLNETSDIYLATQAIDLRASFRSLSGWVIQVLRRDPRCGDVFVFFNKLRNRVKILFYDRSGFCILYKRLDAGSFRLPLVIEPLANEIKIDRDELIALLAGIHIRKH
jgi:transposase